MSSIRLVALLATQLATQAVAGEQVAIQAESRIGDRLIPLISRGAGHDEHCTKDGQWCVLLTEPDAGGEVWPVVRAAGATGAAPLPPTEEPPAGGSYAVWPALFTLKDGSFLAGVQVRTSTSYSGGGGSATDLRLFHVSSDGAADAEPVFNVPLEASLTIRACFGEKDVQERRGACHDEYGFSGRIGLAPGAAAGRPILTYTTEAWAFPSGASRSSDSTRMRALRQSDLVRRRDAACSFTRQFRFDAVAGAYRPDMPLPECSDYTVP
jgi:hypothetical protein